MITTVIVLGLRYFRSGTGGEAIDSLAVLPFVNSRRKFWHVTYEPLRLIFQIDLRTRKVDADYGEFCAAETPHE